MIKYIKNIETEIIQENTDTVILTSNIGGKIGLEDYVDVYNFKGFLQNFTKVETKDVIDVNYKGVLDNTQKIFFELNIDYENIFDCYKLKLTGYGKYGEAIFDYNGENIDVVPNSECCSLFNLVPVSAPNGKYYCFTVET